MKRFLSHFSLALALVTSFAFRATQAAEVTLAWDPNPEPDIAGYRLYSGVNSGVYNQEIEVGPGTTTLVSNLVPGRTYFFAVTAYNTDIVESSPSNEVSYTAPGGSPTPTPSASPTPSPTPSATPVPTPVISIAASPTMVRAGQTSTYTVAASVINPNAAVTIGYAMNGTAILGTHYTLGGVYRQITIPAGASSATVTLTAIQTPTNPKTATMTLSAGSGYVLSSSKSATVTISNSAPSPTPTPSPTPSPPPTPTPTPSPSPTATPSPTPTPTSTPAVTVTAPSAKLKTGQGADYTITASVSPRSPITINYSMSGTAKLGTHYTLSGPTRQVTIPAGANSATVTLTVIKGSTQTKTATMTLTAGSGYATSSPKIANISMKK